MNILRKLVLFVIFCTVGAYAKDCSKNFSLMILGDQEIGSKALLAIEDSVHSKKGAFINGNAALLSGKKSHFNTGGLTILFEIKRYSLAKENAALLSMSVLDSVTVNSTGESTLATLSSINELIFFQNETELQKAIPKAVSALFTPFYQTYVASNTEFTLMAWNLHSTLK